MLSTPTGVPAVVKSECTLSSSFSLDCFLREFQSSTNGLSPDIEPKVFKLEMDADGNYTHGIPYNPNRVALRVSFKTVTGGLL